MFFDSLSFDPVLPWWIILGFSILAGVLSCLRPGFGHLTTWQHRTLVTLRLLALSLLVLAMMRPGWLQIESRQQRAVVPLLLDISKSMQLAHANEGATRYEVARQVMQKVEAARPLFAEKDIELQVFGFDGSLVSIDPEASGDAGETATGEESSEGAQVTQGLPNTPTGRETDVLGAIDGVIRQNRNRRIAGFVMLTDGVVNAVRPQTTANELTRLLTSRDTPVHGMIFGPSTVAEDFLDAAVEAMPDNLAGFAENEIEFRASVRLRGFNRQSVPVQLLVRTPTGEEFVAQTKQITADSQDFLAQVDFNYLPPEPGSYKLHVVVPGQPREVALSNNRLSAYLEAFPGGLRVLYVTGDLQFEHHFLVRSLQASKDIQVRTIWIDSSDRSRWPVDLRKEWADESYDVVVLDNIDAGALHSTSKPGLEPLAKSILDGRGLLMMGGYHSFGPGGYAGTPLEEVLPVRMATNERQGFDAPLRTDMHWEKPIQMRPTADHYITRLGGEDGSLEVWEQLPKLRGANRFDRLKESALVLLESDDRDPLLVAGSYGGRVLAFAGDSTYLWIRAGFEEPHQQFWRQLMLWLASRDVAGEEGVWMRLSKRRALAGERLYASAGIRGEGASDLTGVQVTATLYQPAGSTVSVPFSLQADRTQLNATLDPEWTQAGGVYRMEVTVSRDGETLGTESQEFDVLDIDSETVVPIADPSLVQQLADATAESGGQVWAPQQVELMLQSLLKSTESLELKIPQLWRLGDTSTDALLFVVAFFGLMMTQWALRKYWGLV
jgi:uncharacterized membrane protein